MNYLKLIFLCLVLFCKTPPSKEIQPPIDFYDVIDEAVRVEPEVKNSNLKPESKLAIIKTTNSLKECQEYSSKAYSKVLEIENRLNKLELENNNLKEENQKLKDELSFYRYVKFGLILSSIIFLLYKLGIFQLVFGLIKKMIFPVG